MSSADISVGPVPKNEWSDISTSNKIVEYMYFGLPVVGYDLREARKSAGDAGAYAEPNSETDLAQVISDLLDDEPRRAEMSELGRKRLERHLSWEYSVAPLLEAYSAALEE